MINSDPINIAVLVNSSEDDQSWPQSIQRLLQHQSPNIKSEVSGIEFSQLSEIPRPDVIMSCENIRGNDGGIIYEAADIVAAIREKTASIVPVVIMTMSEGSSGVSIQGHASAVFFGIGGNLYEVIHSLRENAH